MNPSTLIGIVASIGLLAVVMLFAAKEPALFIDLPSLGIVLVGTLAATFISYPLREVTRVFGLIWTVMRNERLYTRQDLDELVQICDCGSAVTYLRWKKRSSRSAIPFCAPACSW